MSHILDLASTTVAICYVKSRIYLVICYVLYAGCYMPSLICQFLYVEYHMLASYYECTVISVYMPISVPVSACSMTNLACQL
jgi:hypothetical protein